MYQITSEEQQQKISNIIQNPVTNGQNIGTEKETEPMKKCGETSLEMSVTQADSKCGCVCKRSINSNNVQEIGQVLKELINSRKSGQTKIKLEIEFDN